MIPAVFNASSIQYRAVAAMAVATTRGDRTDDDRKGSSKLHLTATESASPAQTGMENVGAGKWRGYIGVCHFI